MKSKKVKICYLNPYNNTELSELFLYPIINKNLEVTEDTKSSNSDLTIAHIHKEVPKKDTYKKLLLLSGENLYYSINLFKLIERVFKRINVDVKFVHNFLPRKILNIPIFLARKNYLRFLENNSKENNNIYAILTNSLRGSNIFSLPFFLQVGQIINRLNQLKNKRKLKIKKDRFCCFVVSNESSFERIDFFKELCKYKKVDCFGSTSLTNSDNSELPRGCFDNFSFFSRYKFVICFENSFNADYITEKLPNVMLGGAVPIYRGAPNVKEYFNTNSFINFDDYKRSYFKMIEKIKELDQDDNKYHEFLNRPWLTEKNKLKIKNKLKDLDYFIKRILYN